MILFRGKEYQCQMEITLGLIGGKWKILILHHLGQETVLRFNELYRMHPGLTQKMLAQQLKELEHDGLVHRQQYNQIPPKVEYSLTGQGQSLLPILKQMLEWGQAYVKSRSEAVPG